jgi:hypothetical protein
MPPIVCPCSVARPTAAELNEQIRRFTAGRTVWSPDALRELAVLRAEWRAAVDRETVVPAA